MFNNLEQPSYYTPQNLTSDKGIYLIKENKKFQIRNSNS